MGGKSGGGLLGDPRWLAAGAGGLLAAVAALWAIRGLPLGGLAIWVAPLPIFLVGLGFGLVPGAGALVVAAAALLLSQGALPLLVFLLGFGLPAVLLLAFGLRGGAIRPALPLALLGLWPVAVTLGLALAFGGRPEGLEGAMRRSLELSFTRAGLALPEEAIMVAARLKPALLGAIFAAAMAANAALAQRLLTRAGLALAPTPRWAAASRLPAWYPALPALALLWWALPAVPGGLSPGIALALLVPLFLQGLAATHVALPRGRAGRRTMLGLLYALLIFPATSTPVVVLVTGFGLIAQWWRHPGGSAAGPPGSGGIPT